MENAIEFLKWIWDIGECGMPTLFVLLMIAGIAPPTNWFIFSVGLVFLIAILGILYMAYVERDGPPEMDS